MASPGSDIAQLSTRFPALPPSAGGGLTRCCDPGDGRCDYGDGFPGDGSPGWLAEAMSFCAASSPPVGRGRGGDLFAGGDLFGSGRFW